MATLYSDLFSSSAGATSKEIGFRADAGIGHGRVRYKRAKFTADTANGDVIHLMQMNSKDRIVEMWFTSEDSGTTGVVDLGLYKVSDGSAIDDDLFASAIDTNAAAVARTEVFKEATTLADLDRGQPLWFLADKGAGTYTADPGEAWYLSATMDTGSSASFTFMVEVLYQAGD